MKLKIKVVPGASRDNIAGWFGDALKMRVSAPPEKGKANRAVQKLIAGKLGIPLNSIEIISGATSPHKVVEIIGIDKEEVLAGLGID